MLRSLILGCLLAWGGPATAAETLARQIPGSVYEHDSGSIRVLDFGAWTVRIDGTDYEVARDVIVFDEGIESAFTLLSVGDAVQFTFERGADGMRRRLIRVVEVVDPERVEQH
ncbi:MAG TPA: hypothetical protein RMF84_00475 [Polyangiaceae bacterium LLY-WYZ-14_1]|nr:hypothetical protein [Polyangiaceae bacterium LLY-WYZ-14_1]